MAEAPAPMSDAQRERLARILLAPLLLGLIIAAILCRWHSPFCVDNRTYLEMIQGVARFGLPIVSNGPAGRFPELQIRWDQMHGGVLWGSYPPVYPYLAAPFFRLGGARLVTQLNIALLAVLAIGVFQLGRRLTRDPLTGTAAAYLTLLATHIWTFSFDISPYTTMLTGATWSVALAAAALDEGGPRARWQAFGAGLLGAIAAGAHMLAAPALAAVIALLCVLPASGELPLLRTKIPLVTAAEAWLPSRETLRRGALAIAGTLVIMVPVALLNRYRFGTFSPMSTGGCVWQTCRVSNLAQQGLGSMLAFNSWLFVWAGVVAIALYAVRGSRVAAAGVVVVALCVLLPPSKLHNAAFGMGTLFTAFVFDLSLFDVAGFWRSPDHFGIFLGPHTIKSLLQSAPWLAVAVAGSFSATRDRRLALVIALPAVGVIASLALRGEITLLYALGFPYLDLRYVTPMLPFLAVLAVSAMRGMGWRPWHVVALLVLAVPAYIWCARAPNDVPYIRRVVILRATLVLAALSFVATAFARARGHRWARGVAIATTLAAIALSMGIDLGIDLRAWFNDRTQHDLTSARVGAVTPARFALIGLVGPGGIDAAATLRVTRDMQYADVEELEGHFDRFLPLVNHWTAEGRPVFVLAAPGFLSPWDGYDARLEDPRINLYSLRRR